MGVDCCRDPDEVSMGVSSDGDTIGVLESRSTVTLSVGPRLGE